jgi:uncharacterized membrane protein
MRPLSYAKRLTSDLDTWINNGWVTDENAKHIRASLVEQEGPSRLPLAITVLGSVLIGFSAMAFVAANWTEMSKGFRLALLALTMWSAYGGAAYLYARNQAGYAEAAILIGIGLFGANIMLIGQMYHLPSDFSAGLLAWALGALVTAWAINSKSALIAAQLLLIGWTSNELTEGTLHLAYLVPWVIATALVIRLDWTPAKHLAVIGLIFWMLGNVPPLAEKFGWEAVEAIITLSACFILMWLVGLLSEQSGRSFGRALQAYGALSTFVLLWIGQLIEEGLQGQEAFFALIFPIIAVPIAAIFASKKVSQITIGDIAAFSAFPIILLISGAPLSSENGSLTTAALWVIAPTFLILSVWLVTFGTRLNNRFLINLGFAAFGAEALFLYLETFGTLLDTAAFFAIGGVLLIAGGYVWERLRRQATATQAEISS